MFKHNDFLLQTVESSNALNGSNKNIKHLRRGLESGSRHRGSARGQRGHQPNRPRYPPDGAVRKPPPLGEASGRMSSRLGQTLWRKKWWTVEWTFDEFEHQIPFCSRVLTHLLATSSLSDEQEEALEMVSSQDKSGHRACTHHQATLHACIL